MKKNLYILMAAGLVSASALVSCGGQVNEAAAEGNDNSAESAEVKNNQVKTDASSLIWKGTMLGVYSHEGSIDIAEGSLETTGDKVTGGSFTVDLNTIKPTDENYDPAQDRSPEKLVGHLQSPDFFDVASFPTAKFVITGSNGNTVTGNLTIRGITHEETIQNVIYDEASQTWTGNLTFDRKKYDVSWDSQMKEMVLSNDIELKISLSI